MNYPLLLSFLVFTSCTGQPSEINAEKTTHATEASALKNIETDDTISKTIHVFVALCDNKYQGIVPVPPKIGNGQDPGNNLYWGCAFGIRTFFKNSNDWKLIKSQKSSEVRLERLVFKHATRDFYLVADAYDGQFIEQCTREFLQSCSGQLKDTIHVKDKVIGIDGNSKLVAYIGHDGLMDFQLNTTFENKDGKTRDCIILACVSKSYFAPYLKPTKANPLVWTTGLMCPEAYTLHDALTGYVNQETQLQIQKRAALAYSKYQKCSVKAAGNLLVTGW